MKRHVVLSNSSAASHVETRFDSSVRFERQREGLVWLRLDDALKTDLLDRFPTGDPLVSLVGCARRVVRSDKGEKRPSRC
jgi:hypothetical protein